MNRQTEMSRTDWERYFGGSQLYGTEYHGDKLPPQKWEWPQGTKFQLRMAQVKAQEAGVADTKNG